MLTARIAAFLKEHGWLLNLLFILIGAYFVAGAANAVVARSIRVMPSLESMPQAASKVGSVGRVSRSASFQAMAERNLLGVKREQLQPVTAAPDQIAAGNAGCKDFREEQLKPCTLAATVRGTLVADDLPEWSMAVILDNTTHEPEVFNINEGTNKIADDAFLCQVRSRAIVVQRRDHVELCAVEGEGANPAPTTLASATPPIVAPAEGGDEGGGGPGVTKVSETQYTVERKEVDNALSNLSEIATQARIVPSFKNGKPNGFKMFSIKPGSIYSKIGMKNGDVIQKINGYEINSPDKALELYQKLKDASSVAIELQRRGQTMNVNYNIQ
ncbi:MAG: PDZ domain-containing protein [Deltaproteobacteria bacterium]|nr:PDZ domain-containing protein [Deltaproteobacteria bacterium]